MHESHWLPIWNETHDTHNTDRIRKKFLYREKIISLPLRKNLNLVSVKILCCCSEKFRAAGTLLRVHCLLFAIIAFQSWSREFSLQQLKNCYSVRMCSNKRKEVWTKCTWFVIPLYIDLFRTFWKMKISFEQ